jgi:hypothetical protein
VAGPSLEERRRRRLERALSLIAIAVLAWSLVDWHGFNDFWHIEGTSRGTPFVLRLIAAAWVTVDAVTFLKRRAARRRS